MTSSLSFRGLPLGSACSQILDLGSPLLLNESYYLYLQVGISPPIFNSTPLNPNGENIVIVELLNRKVSAHYNCREGVLFSGKYDNIPLELLDNLLSALRKKYGDPNTGTRSLSIKKWYEWNLPGGGEILAEVYVTTVKIEYSNEGLVKFLDKKQALRLSTSDEI